MSKRAAQCMRCSDVIYVIFIIRRHVRGVVNVNTNCENLKIRNMPILFANRVFRLACSIPVSKQSPVYDVIPTAATWHTYNMAAVSALDR